ncbi:hypothetical protein ACFPL7_08925 [Dongia soli]|uniref:Uncharacterized protein n=1 Tax=Dongia soli TaxID=600628 RepID=A0ABU5EBY1_9PROT|nr:hypothetical protein [Dongia soli]MDY0883070.1 hypothetical protein [Dongia soli]
MRRFLLIFIAVIVVTAAIVVGAIVWTIGQLDDPASRPSLAFKARFAEGCVKTASESGSAGSNELSDQQRNDLASVCDCAAEYVRQDVAETGVAGTLHMLIVEGPKAKLLRALDSCQTTPSAP